MYVNAIPIPDGVTLAVEGRSGGMKAGTSIAVGNGDEHIMILSREGLAQGVAPLLFSVRVSIRAETDGYERAFRDGQAVIFYVLYLLQDGLGEKYGLFLIFEGDTQGAIAALRFVADACIGNVHVSWPPVELVDHSRPNAANKPSVTTAA